MNGYFSDEKRHVNGNDKALEVAVAFKISVEVP